MLFARLSGPSRDTEGRYPSIDTMFGPRLPAICSQWMPSSKNASPPAMVSSLRQSPAVFSRFAMVVKCAKTISPIAPSATSFRSTTRERLVVIVFADEHHAVGVVARLDRLAVVLDARKRRFFDQHMFARRKRAQRRDRDESSAERRRRRRRRAGLRWPRRSPRSCPLPGTGGSSPRPWRGRGSRSCRRCRM